MTFYILEHPDVLEVCVVGLPHPTDWEHARAFIVRKNHSKLTEGQVVEMVQGMFGLYSSFCVPQIVVVKKLNLNI